MTWLNSILISRLSGIVGVLLTGFIANACVSWYRISSFEGKSGYFVIFMAMVGGLAGTIAGYVTARLAAGYFGPDCGRQLGCALGVGLLIGGVSAVVCRLFVMTGVARDPSWTGPCACPVQPGWTGRS